MKIQFPKAHTFNEIKNGELFACEFGGKTYNCLKTEPIFNRDDVEFNAVNVVTGEHIWVDEDEYVTILNGHYVVEVGND